MKQRTSKGNEKKAKNVKTREEEWQEKSKEKGGKGRLCKVQVMGGQGEGEEQRGYVWEQTIDEGKA